MAVPQARAERRPRGGKTSRARVKGSEQGTPPISERL
eukprot:CAMPEP_0194771920 /NCGR_PEP_ID=MMETSP0323_2-20130528/50514_1 /TAXON_ID=2866 ORGANISM="Crypthecodinium cohnii, Strain Seligo" /NCGR_SAMPLE_ID=MMETSP0323_2 /ASSEMBLY_ACC=CAM_ASM_000346 /LENGTH=36 /DNA_ID= /DNA_START= /DNA_END= /DNA_ORIENTATION=